MGMGWGWDGDGMGMGWGWNGMGMRWAWDGDGHGTRMINDDGWMVDAPGHHTTTPHGPTPCTTTPHPPPPFACMQVTTLVLQVETNKDMYPKKFADRAKASQEVHLLTISKQMLIISYQLLY